MKLYLKFGAEASSNPKQARLVAKYDNKNKTELIWAIVFKEPMSRMTWTNAQDKNTATSGLFRQIPLETNWSNFPETIEI